MEALLILSPLLVWQVAKTAIVTRTVSEMLREFQDASRQREIAALKAKRSALSMAAKGQNTLTSLATYNAVMRELTRIEGRLIKLCGGLD